MTEYCPECEVTYDSCRCPTCGFISDDAFECYGEEGNADPEGIEDEE